MDMMNKKQKMCSIRDDIIYVFYFERAKIVR